MVVFVDGEADHALVTRGGYRTQPCKDFVANGSLVGKVSQAASDMLDRLQLAWRWPRPNNPRYELLENLNQIVFGGWMVSTHTVASFRVIVCNASANARSNRLSSFIEINRSPGNCACRRICQPSQRSGHRSLDRQPVIGSVLF